MKKDLISIKGTKNGLIIIISPELDFEKAVSLLKEKFVESNGFFKSAHFNIQGDQFNKEQRTELEEICVSFGLVILKVKEEIAASVIMKEVSRGDTLLIMKNLRSGQTINHEGNIVIVGDVNPGAEVISGGNIIVMGKLRGVAHAGSRGKNDAYILAYRLLPTQLRISNNVSRAPENQNSLNYPEIARSSEDGIFIEKYARRR